MRPSAALRVLNAVNDPRSSAPTVAKLVELDPGLTAQMIRLANSVYYRRSEPVGTVQSAIVVIGYRTVGALAVLTALSSGHDQPMPAQFWDHSVAAAVAASYIAPKLGGDSQAAFTAGMLHDVGHALLCRVEPEVYAELQSGIERGEENFASEVATFGMDHAQAASLVLRSWAVPEEIVTAVEGHHKPLAGSTPLGRATVAGDVLATLAWHPELVGHGPLRDRLVEAARIEPGEILLLVGRVGELIGRFTAGALVA